MRIIFTVSFFLVAVVTVFAQPKKMFVNSKGKISLDSVKAVAYILEEKVGDSAYAIAKYDLKHQPISRGTYKDAFMTVRSGKFYSYGKYRVMGLEIQGTGDVYVYLASSGYYLNGIRTGPWLVYDFSGVKMEQFTFENGILNGPYKRFNTDSGVTEEEGNFTNGKREGESKIYSGKDTTPDCTITYKNDLPIKTVIHNLKTAPPKNLDQYLSKTLNGYIDTLKAMEVKISLVISNKGKIDSVMSFNRPLPDYISKAIKTAFLSAPSFTPGKHDDVDESQEYLYNFKHGTGFHAIGTLVFDSYARDSDLILWGLNQFGIGKNVTQLELIKTGGTKVSMPPSI